MCEFLTTKCHVWTSAENTALTAFFILLKVRTQGDDSSKGFGFISNHNFTLNEGADIDYEGQKMYASRAKTKDDII